MFDTHERLDVTQDELAVIEAALHTQAKILHVQAAAGGSGARRRLNDSSGKSGKRDADQNAYWAADHCDAQRKQTFECASGRVSRFPPFDSQIHADEDDENHDKIFKRS